MKARVCSLITLLVVSGSLPGWMGAREVEPFIEECPEAVVNMSDGRSYTGSIVGAVGDNLLFTVRDSAMFSDPWAPREVQSSRDFWGYRSDDPVEPDDPAAQEGLDSVARRQILLPFGEIKLLRCGDSEKDGALKGFLTGAVLGATFGVMATLAEDGPGWLAVPYAAAITAPPFGLYGAIIDRYHGGRVREYSGEDLSAADVGEQPWTGSLPVGDRTPGSRRRFGVIIGPSVQRLATRKSMFDSMVLVGGRLTFMSRKGVFGEFSVGRAERGGEQWISYAADAGITLVRVGRFLPYGQLGLRHYERDYSESFRGYIPDPDENHYFDVTLGGGMFIDVSGGRLLARPAFLYHYPLGSWVEYELEVGLYYGF